MHVFRLQSETFIIILLLYYYYNIIVNFLHAQIDDSGYIALTNNQNIVRTPYSARTIGFPFKRTTSNVDWSAVVAPFWADIATGGNKSGRIYYKSFTKGQEAQATDEIRTVIASTIPQLRGFTPEWTLIITWDQVGYYRINDDKVMQGRLFLF